MSDIDVGYRVSHVEKLRKGMQIFLLRDFKNESLARFIEHCGKGWFDNIASPTEIDFARGD